MELKKLVGLSSALAVSAMSLAAQEANPAALSKQLEELLRIQKHQAEQIESLKKQIETLKGQPFISDAKVAKPELKLEELERRVSELTNERVAKPWRPGDPIGLVRAGQSYLNMSLDGLFTAGGSTARDLGALQPGGHDPNQRGFSIQNVEAVFEGMVDPYFRGQANIVYQLNAAGESVFELEEAYLESLSLPGNLQLKVGQFFTEFGRLNPSHPHTWSFVDQPLVNGRMFGADGLRNPGARLSWLLPTPFYSELSFTMQNGQGETAQSFRSDHGNAVFLGRTHTARNASALRDFIFTPRWQTSWELTDAQTLLVGASAAFGANGSDANTETQIYGTDLLWKWKPANHTKGFPFVTWQTEAMLRKYQAGAFNNATDDANANLTIDGTERNVFGDASIRFVPRETLTDYGFYSQVSYGFRPGWVAGARWDFVTSDRAQYENLFGIDAARDTRWRLSPNLTWFPSEFSKIRLQYNYDQRQHIGVDHSLWLQFEFLLGSHSAHKF